MKKMKKKLKAIDKSENLSDYYQKFPEFWATIFQQGCKDSFLRGQRKFSKTIVGFFIDEGDRKSIVFVGLPAKFFKNPWAR